MLRPPSDPPIPGTEEEMDGQFKEAVEVVVQYDRASASLLQRRLSVGYARAARIIDQLEAAGVLGPAQGSEPREVLIRSVDEILSGTPEKEKAKEEDPFVVPKNYKTPTISLSKLENIPWGKQFRDIFESKDFKETEKEFSFPIGYSEEGNLHFENLLNAGNLIVAGNPLSQKENFIDSLLLTLLLRHSPHKLRFILNDNTHYLDLYNNIPHLLSPVINDDSRQISAFKWALAEMDRRMKHFSEAGVRDIKTFNEGKGFSALPYILIVSFMSYFDIGSEDAIIRLTTLGVRAGIHNIVVVDRTSGASLPNMIKSNIPTRIAFRLTSVGDSKAIDIQGAEKLEPGELVYKPNYRSTLSLKGIFTPEVNVKEVVSAIKQSPSSI